MLAIVLAVGLVGAPARGADEPAASQPAEVERRALAASEAGDLRQAILLYQEAALVCEAAGDAQGRFRSLLRQGEFARDLGRSRDAIARLEAAATLAEASLAAPHVAAARGALGSAWLAAGDAPAAETQLALACGGLVHLTAFPAES